MSENSDGGPAFPQNETKSGNPMHVEFASGGGMSLRDYLAAAALPGLIVATFPKTVETNEKMHDCFSMGAKHSYAIADAMLAERKKARTQ